MSPRDEISASAAPAPTPDIALVEAAARRLEGVALRTPLLESEHLNALAGRRVLVKAECLQRTGSFKFRGAWARLTAMGEEQRRRGVLAFSSGNHAQGVALAARLLGVRAVVAMPADAPALKIDNTRALGAEVVTYDRLGGVDREQVASEILAREPLILVRPFDDPWVIAGQGSCGLELAEQAAEAGVAEADVFVCCGGGGLAAGIALALEARAPGLRVRTAEPEEFDDAARSLALGRRVRNAALSGSICDAILTPEPGELTFPVLRRLAGPGVAVSDAEALAAMAAAFLRLKLVLEPGGAVALAAALRPAVGASRPVIAVATGGNVEPETFRLALAAAPAVRTLRPAP